MAAGFFALAAAPTMALAVVAGIPLGIGRSGFMLLDQALLMANADRAFHGRVVSLTMMGFGSQALLAPLWGAVADWIGVRATLVVVGMAAAAITAGLGLGLAVVHRADAQHGEQARR